MSRATRSGPQMLAPISGMAAQATPLLVGERLHLVQQLDGDGDLADVVQQRAVRDALQLGSPQAHERAQAGRPIGHVPAVVLEVTVLGLDRIGQGDHDRMCLLHAPWPSVAPQGPTDPGQQLQGMTGLEDDVVGAGVEGAHPMVERGPLGQRQHGQRRGPVVRAQATEQLEGVHTRQAEGQDQQVGLVFVDRVEAVLAIGDSVDAIPGPRKDLRQLVTNDRVILDDCHAGSDERLPGSVWQRCFPLTLPPTIRSGPEHSIPRRPPVQRADAGHVAGPGAPTMAARLGRLGGDEWADAPRSPACCSRSLVSTTLLAGAGASAAAAENDYPAKDSGYHDYPEMVQALQDAQAAHPDIVRVFSIGESYQGRTIWAAEVSDHVGEDEGEPEVMFDGLHHAREHLSAEMPLYILRLLAGNYGKDTALRASGSPHRGHPPDLDHPHGQPRRPGVRPGWRPVPQLAQEPPAQPGLERRGHRPQSQLRLRLVERRSEPRLHLLPRAGPRSRHPRPRPSATSCSAGAWGGCSASGPTSRSTRPASTCSGRTATPTRRCRRT